MDCGKTSALDVNSQSVTQVMLNHKVKNIERTIILMNLESEAPNGVAVILPEIHAFADDGFQQNTIPL